MVAFILLLLLLLLLVETYSIFEQRNQWPCAGKTKINHRLVSRRASFVASLLVHLEELDRVIDGRRDQVRQVLVENFRRMGTLEPITRTLVSMLRGRAVGEPHNERRQQGRDGNYPDTSSARAKER